MSLVSIRSLQLFLLVASVFLVAAKCVDHTSLYQRPSGDWVLVGEMHNETDVQGTGMILAGTLFDDAGNVLTTGQGPLCPFELSPHSLSVFEINFPKSASVPRPARYEVRTVAGKALASPLHKLDITLSDLRATRTKEGVHITGDIVAHQPYPGVWGSCAAIYDASGNVIRELTITGLSISVANAPPNVVQPLDIPLTVFPSADFAGVRLWIVGPIGTSFESNYTAVATDILTVP